MSLFVYGTLLPRQSRWLFLAPFVVDGGEPDEVVGQLFDTGEGYPAARFGPTGRIVGRVFELVEERAQEALARLDEIEGAVGGDYHRIECTTVGGRRVWAYQYGGGLELRPIASGSWLARDRSPG